MTMQAVQNCPESREEEDDALIARYREAGDVAALDTLVRRHADMLTRYLRGMLNAAADVDDAFQEVWLKVVRRPEAYRNSNFRGWLIRIAHNVAIDRYRRQRPTVSFDACDDEGGSLADTLPSGDATPRRVAADADTLGLIAARVRALPDTQRQVFLMRVAGDLSFKEIAAALKVPLNTALGRMHYAVTRLREELTKDRDAWSGRTEP
jgi:RNA polymerase sigma-70 factor (ECF subfamily)